MTEFPPPADENTPEAVAKPKRNAFTRFLDGVEWLGNLLPHPVTLFALLAVGIVLLSGLFGWMVRWAWRWSIQGRRVRRAWPMTG